MATVEQPGHRGAERAAFERGQQAGLGRAQADIQRRVDDEQGYQQGAADMGRQILAGLGGNAAVPQGNTQVSPEEEIAGLLNDAQNGSEEAGARLNEIASQGGEEMINSVAQQLNNAQGINGGEAATPGGDILEMIYAADSGDQAAGDALNVIAGTPEGEAQINEAMRMIEAEQPQGPQARLR